MSMSLSFVARRSFVKNSNDSVLNDESSRLLTIPWYEVRAMGMQLVRGPETDSVRDCSRERVREGV